MWAGLEISSRANDLKYTESRHVGGGGGGTWLHCLVSTLASAAGLLQRCGRSNVLASCFQNPQHFLISNNTGAAKPYKHLTYWYPNSLYSTIDQNWDTIGKHNAELPEVICSPPPHKFCFTAWTLGTYYSVFMWMAAKRLTKWTLILVWYCSGHVCFVFITLLHAAITSTVPLSVSFRAPAQSTAPRELASSTRCMTKTLFKLSRNDWNINWSFDSNIVHSFQQSFIVLIYQVLPYPGPLVFVACSMFLTLGPGFSLAAWVV